jgi:hypothetical protein
MNKIDKDELFRHVSEFWKAKGIELQPGTYTQRIKKGCDLLASTVNLGQEAFERAKVEMEKHLEQMRQVIHEKTAPKTPPRPPQPQSSTAQGKKGGAKPAGARKSSKGKTGRRR